MATNSFVFRLAKEKDAEELVRLINTAFRADATDEVFLSADHASIDVTDVPSIRSSIAQAGRAVLVATSPDDDDTIVAHCSVRKAEGDCAWFGLLAVNVNYQNRGLGRQALAAAEQYARREFHSARMEFDVVRTRAGLLSWYMRQGYEATGRTIPFPYEHHGDWKDVLRDDLYFIVLGKDLVSGSTE